jgi:ketosteroid isomerase-like protein
MLNKEKFIHYIQSYAAKDLNAVANLFAENIVLRDWKISVQGKAAAVAETEKNFANAQTIEIEILSTLVSETEVAGELKIVVDGSEVLYAIDVLSFNEQGKIAAIRAYIGRES